MNEFGFMNIKGKHLPVFWVFFSQVVSGPKGKDYHIMGQVFFMSNCLFLLRFSYFASMPAELTVCSWMYYWQNRSRI